MSSRSLNWLSPIFIKLNNTGKQHNVLRMYFIAHWYIAKTLRPLQRVEEALAIQRDLLIKYQQRNEIG
ncbi:MAG: hypothetical protein GFH27_549321n157 [Chloroflexi bacterium AL-W]|nr:hypothetical protein [Chloroflexi bacterium AL-N1]NOK65034.1 hypothetical protein [Chloroflexi bacterium AL-N10]NOK76804.1 hypothetical protein [Chloroflexi bacterium AL-N5]NOK84696.1 hypothetical protein [Chloroflexi bacterium AL-W]NOK86479.1 hypothetical protein [Chloroflexi bacterium AL-N15]